jgi:hypothetical protein
VEPPEAQSDLNAHLGTASLLFHQTHKGSAPFVRVHRSVGKCSIVSYNEKEPRQSTKCRSSFATKTTHTARNQFGLLPTLPATSKRPSWPVSRGCGTYPDQKFSRFAAQLRPARTHTGSPVTGAPERDIAPALSILFNLTRLKQREQSQ